jgi:ADP-heptose:LPS heptosyltransferase
MYQNTLYNKLFLMSSRLTERFPRLGAWLLNLIFLGLLGNQFFIDNCLARDIERLNNTNEFKRILIIGDMNIGDAVNLQASISALRGVFPDAEIHYMIKRIAACIIDGNPDISALLPVFTGAPYPNENDFQSIKQIVMTNHYNVIFNFCPFIKDNLFPPQQPVINCLALALIILRNAKDKTTNNHVAYQSYEFISKLLSSLFDIENKQIFKGVDLTLSDGAIRRALNFLRNNGLPRPTSLILLNPDTSSPFTRIPFQIQVSLLKQIIELPCVALLGSSHTSKRIQSNLLNTMPLSQRNKIIIVPPSMPLDAYAALVDVSNVFITGDTGLLHIAAARKVSKHKDYQFRNKTAILSIFGATPARIYGYDSALPGYMSANQEAPSHAYVAASPCRNITCINKMAKTCKIVRCFQSLDIGRIMRDIKSFLSVAHHHGTTGLY